MHTINNIALQGQRHRAGQHVTVIGKYQGKQTFSTRNALKEEIDLPVLNELFLAP